MRSLRFRKVSIRLTLSSLFSTNSGPAHNPAQARGAPAVQVTTGVQDYSKIHQPIGSLFGPLPKSAGAWKAFELTPEQVESFHANGYLTGIDALTDDQCDLLLHDYRQFLDWDPRGEGESENSNNKNSNNNNHNSNEKENSAKKLHPGHGLFHEFHANQTGDPNAVLMHALGHWRITANFHDLVFHPALSVPTSQLLGGVAVQLWHDQLFAKPANYGGNVAWHQDYSYWTRTRPMQHMTVHIALDTQTIENGTLHFIPGSHRWHRNGEPLPITDADFKDMDSIKKVLTEEELKMWKPTPALLKKGQVSFHHPLTVHGSFSNRSNSPRRAAVVNYFASGTRYESDLPPLHGVPSPGRGEVLKGDFFPTVFQGTNALIKSKFNKRKV